MSLESLACDCWWRLNNLYTIKDKHGVLIPFKPNAVQTKFYFSLHWLNYCLKSRQHGLSTFMAIFILDRLLFEEGKRAGVIDYRQDDGKKKLGMMKLAYEHLDNKELHPDTWRFGKEIKKLISITKGEKVENPEELIFSNKSMVYTSTTMRGGTLQYLHVSEYGKIALKDQEKAKEVISGSENACHEGSITVYETTHEGGKYGKAYEMCEAAINNGPDRKKLTRLDSLFHFYAWFEDPANQLTPHEASLVNFSKEERKYFAQVGKEGVYLTLEQKAWYALKWRRQGDDMKKEHPSTPEEAFEVAIKGAIYAAEISKLRRRERIVPLSVDLNYPVYTFWDLGAPINTAIWWVQIVGRDVLVLDYESGQDYTTGQRVAQINQKDFYYGGHILPHDGGAKQKGGLSYAEELEKAGLKGIRILPQTRDVNVGINALRGMMPSMWFDSEKCALGLESLEAYRMKFSEKLDMFLDEPEHDWSSHGADALRYLAEASLCGFLKTPHSGGMKKPKVRTMGKVSKPRVRR